jgi:hypothetical protein
VRASGTSGAAGADHIAGSGRHRQAGKIFQIEPPDAFRVVAGVEVAACYGAIEIDEHVVILAGAAIAGHDALEDRCDLVRRYSKASLFENFTHKSVFQAFPGLNGPARQRPVLRQRRFAAFDQQYPASVKNQGTDAEDRTSRVLAAAVASHFNKMLQVIAANTSSAWPSTLTLGKIFLILPSEPIMNVVRSMLMYFFPYMLFSFQTP